MTERFEGYPDDGLRFLRGLARHNDRDWFEERRPRYRDGVRLPTLRLAAAINEALARHGPAYVTPPTRAVPRLARDRRFHPDRPPYKTYTSALFGYGGAKLLDGCGFAVRIAPDGVTIGGGAFQPAPAQLARVRGAIASDPSALTGILKRPALRRRMGALRGARTIRVPPGHDADHPAAADLCHRQFFLEAEHGLDLARSRALVTQTTYAVRVMRPFVDWLARVLGLEGVYQSSP